MEEWHHFTNTQLANLLGVSLPTIAAAIDEGAPGVCVRGGKGRPYRVDGRLFLPWFIAREAERARSEPGVKRLDEQELELDITIKRERLKQLHAEHVPRLAFVQTMREIVRRLHQVVREVPESEAEHVVALPDRQAAIDALTVMGDRLRTRMRAPELWVSPQPDETPESPEFSSPALL